MKKINLDDIGSPLSTTNAFFCGFIDKLPPSSNHIKAVYRGRLTTTNKAKEYKIYAFEQLKEFEPPEFGRNDPLRLRLTFRFKNLVNKTWPNGKAKYRYRKRDVSNLVKLLEDVVSTYLEIDDSQILEIVARKVQSDEEGVVIWVEKM